MMTKLEARRDELAALPQRDEDVRYEPTGTTVREHWASLTHEDRGAFLRQRGVRIFADRKGWVVQLGWDDPDETGSRMAEAFGLEPSAASAALAS
jgi:hypothetical protein